MTTTPTETLNVDRLIQKLIDTKSIVYNKEYNRMARIHKYWSRKPWYLMEKYILKYSNSNNIVLDPFCGSGAVGLEAVLNNRQFIGYDLNPSAIFLTDNILDASFDVEVFEAETQKIIENLKDKILKLYEFGENLYIKYLIVGDSSAKNYNCVATDYNFKAKKLFTVDEAVLNTQFLLPKNLTFPDKAFPKKFYKDRFSYKGVHKVSDMYSSRNICALAMLYDFLQKSDFQYKKLFLLAFSNTLLHVSKLKAENVRPLSVNNYWIPNDYIEENVFWRFLDRVKNVKIGKYTIAKRKQGKKNPTKTSTSFTLYNKSCLGLPEIADNSIDYILTDPPYGDVIQYSELSYIWNCWLQKDYKIEDEVVINPIQNKGLQEFHEQIEQFVIDTQRVLKFNAYFTLCFQNKEVKIWLKIIETIKNQGFELVDIAIYDTFGSPYNKHWAKFSPKSDLYITFKNTQTSYPSPIETVYPDKLVKEITDYFKKQPQKFDLNKAYDLFVAAIIEQIFLNKKISNIEKFNLKNIIPFFEENFQPQNGTLQNTHPTSIQGKFPF